MYGSIAGGRLLSALLVVSVLSAPALIGCGGGSIDPQEAVLSERGKFAELVGTVAEGADDANRFEPLFAAGAAPSVDERAKYGAVRCWLEGEPEITGDSATLTVTIEEKSDTGEALATREVTWTAVKEDDQWKLKDVPLQ